MDPVTGCAADVVTPGEAAALVEQVGRADWEARDLDEHPTPRLHRDAPRAGGGVRAPRRAFA